MSRRVLVGLVAGAVVIVLAWFFLLWQPRQSAYQSASQQADAARGTLQAAQAALRRLQAEASQQPARQAELSQLEQAIPADPQLGDFILDVNDAAVRSGVTFTSISPSAPAAAPAGSGATAGGTPPAITFSLNVSGGYYQMLDFLNRLDSLPRLVVIDSVSLSSGSASAASGAASSSTPASGSSAPELTAAITARMFTSRPPTAGSTATTPTTTPGPTTTTTAGGSPTTTTGSTTTTTASTR